MFSKFLQSSVPKHKFPAKEPKNSAHILTSSESRQILLEKQRKKEEAMAKKEERKQVREKAKLLKAIDAEKKKESAARLRQSQPGFHDEQKNSTGNSSRKFY